MKLSGRRYCFVATAYVVRGGKTLLLKHKKLGMWLPPGGHIDEGETPDEAALREVREETGLEADFVVPTRGPDPADGRVEFPAPAAARAGGNPDEPQPPHRLHLFYARPRRPSPARRGRERGAALALGRDLGGAHVSEEVRDTGRRAIALVEKNAPNC